MNTTLTVLNLPETPAPGPSLSQGTLARTSSAPGADLVAAFLAGRSDRTTAAYRAALTAFTHWRGAPDVAAAVRELLGLSHGAANGAILAYRAALTDRGLSPASVNLALAALRSLVRMARLLGLVAWSVDVPGLKPERRRDSRGPGLAGFRRLLDAAAAQHPDKAARDVAILRLLFDVALRRVEACTLDAEHVNLEAGTLSVLGKGRRERETLTLPPETVAALRAWLDARGPEPGPLFRNMDRAHKGDGRLTPAGLWDLVTALGRRAGVTVRPHGLRHAAITTGLEATGGDVRRVARFARHADVRTTMRYDDERADLAGQVARAVAAAVGS